MRSLLLAAAFTVLFSSACAAQDLPNTLGLPTSGTVKVAFVLSEGATVIDFSGPWDVFESAQPADGRDNPFELFTVAPDKKPVHTSGGKGMTITPDYDFASAPLPDIVVIGAQAGGPGLSEWLQKVHAAHKLILSVCTGAFKVAKAGLLDGKQATTHHDFYDQFAKQYPQVKLVRGVRYLQADPNLFVAGGETSGIDLSLHIVALYLGEASAQNTADYMEYQGAGWKTNVGVAATTPVVVHQEWKGDTASGVAILLHVTYAKGDYTALLDSASQGVTGAPTSVKLDGNHVDFGFDIPRHTATFSGTVNDAGNVLTGTYSQDGKSSPLTLLKQKP